MRVLPKIEVEGARDLSVDRADGRRTDLDDPWREDRLGELGDGRGPARISPAPEVGETLGRLHEDERPVLPQGLAREVASGQIFRKREGPGRDPAHLVPVRDPASRLLWTLHGNRPDRPTPAAHPGPHQRARRKASKEGLERVEAGHRVGQGRGNAASTEDAIEPVLVLTQVDDGLPRQEQTARDLRPEPREGADLRVRGRNEQVDLLPRDHPPQSPEETGVGERGHQIVSIGGRLPEHEPVAVTSNEREGPTSGPEASNQVAGGRRSGAAEEQASPHGRPTRTVIRRLAKARRMIGP